MNKYVRIKEDNGDESIIDSNRVFSAYWKRQAQKIMQQILDMHTEKPNQ